MKYWIALVALVVLTAAIPAGAQPVATTNYSSIQAGTLSMNVWEGTHIAVLTPVGTTYNNARMTNIVTAMDATYDYYKAATGKAPANYSNGLYDGRLTIASVDNTGGAGYSYIGATGIELQTDTFNVLYNGVKNNNRYDQVAFYEFGRNFWTMGNQMNGGKPGDSSIGQYSFTTGFAVFMRFKSMEYAGVNGAPFGSWTFTQFKTNVVNLVDQYTANSTLNFSNTLALGKGVPNSGLGGTDLFASFLFRLGRDYGGDTFFNNVWKEVLKRPTVSTDQGAIDNFFLASSYAAHTNLTNLFVNQWKWNISNSAKTEAAAIVPEPAMMLVMAGLIPLLRRRRRN